MMAYVAYITVELPFANLERIIKSRRTENSMLASKHFAPTIDSLDTNMMKAQSHPTVRIDDQKNGFDSGIVTKYKF